MYVSMSMYPKFFTKFMLHSKYSKHADIYVNESNLMRKLELQTNEEKITWSSETEFISWFCSSFILL